MVIPKRKFTLEMTEAPQTTGDTRHDIGCFVVLAVRVIRELSLKPWSLGEKL